ncbi:MAG: 4a-hydroxytetrahydrobiopterin dehydratase [Acidobacteriota bacterium]|nr:4a-hydroxytetrahydrobiopterin dehydratase [Acidobacteriota bacterium]
MSAEITFYTRKNCPLCDKAREAIRASGADVQVTEVDIDADPELHERYTNDVPVVHVNGEEAFRHRVDPKQFASYIRAGLRGWRVVKGHELEKEYRFDDFAQALAFTNRIGAIAEELNHHPDIHLSWGKVRVTTWSHDVDGLSERDFRLAGRVEG